MATVVDSNLTSNAPYTPGERARVFSFAAQVSGKPVKIVVYTRSDGHTYFALWKNNGSGWVDTQITGLPGTLNVFSDSCFVGMKGISTNTIAVSPGVSHNGAAEDILYIIYTYQGKLYECALSLINNSIVQSHVTTFTLLDYGIGSTKYSKYNRIDCVWDPTASLWHCALAVDSTVSNPALTMVALIDTINAAGSALSNTISFYLDSVYSFTGCTSLQVALTGNGGTGQHVYVGAGITGTGNPGLKLFPIPITGTYTYSTWNWRAAETVSKDLPYTFSMAINPGNSHLEFAYYFYGTSAYGYPFDDAIAFITRSGTNTYGSRYIIAIYLFAGYNQASVNIGLSYDVNTGLQYMINESYVNQSQGEVFWSQRSANGIWQQNQVMVGGDANGYRSATVIPQFDSSGGTTGLSDQLDVLLVTGNSSLYTLEQMEPLATTAPNTPQITAPIGPTSSIRPTFTWNYSNQATSDVQGSYTTKVIDKQTLAIMWPSTTTGGTVASVQYPVTGGSVVGLVAGRTYTFSLSVTDSNNSLASSTAYQDFAVFGAPAIDTLTVEVNGTAYTAGTPAASPKLVLNAEFTQSENLNANYYQIDILAADQSTVVSTSGKKTLASLAPSTFQDFPGSSSFNVLTSSVAGGVIVNGLDYYIRLTLYMDLGTLPGPPLTAQSTNFHFVPNFAGPSPIVGFTATPFADNGYMDLAWTLPGDATVIAVNLYFRRSNSGDPWQALPLTGAPSGFTFYAPVNVACDYYVQGVNTNNVLGTAQYLYSVMLLGKYGGSYPFWINDTTNLANAVALGGLDDGDWETTALIQYNKLFTQILSPGRQKPIMDFKPMNYAYYQQIKWFIPASDWDGSGSPTLGLDVIHTLQALNASSNPLLVRDQAGNMFVMKMDKFSPNAFKGIHWEALMDLYEVDSQTNLFGF